MVLRALSLGLHPRALDRTIDLHVNETRRQYAAPAVPLLVGYEPLLKEQLLWVQNAAFPHPQILPAAERGGGLGCLPSTLPPTHAHHCLPALPRLYSGRAWPCTHRPHTSPEQLPATQDAAVGELEHRGPRSALPVAHLELPEPS